MYLIALPLLFVFFCSFSRPEKEENARKTVSESGKAKEPILAKLN